jgi:hypothetical protein
LVGVELTKASPPGIASLILGLGRDFMQINATSV